MPLVFREIGKLSNWDIELERDGWLGAGEVRADVLKHLRTKDCALSIYFLEHADLAARVAAAYAANHEREVAGVAYALFDANRLIESDFHIKRVRGVLPDSEVAGWHADVVELSASKLAAFAKLVSDAEHKAALTPIEVGRLINRLRSAGKILDDQMSPRLVGELQHAKFTS